MPWARCPRCRREVHFLGALVAARCYHCGGRLEIRAVRVVLRLIRGGRAGR